MDTYEKKYNEALERARKIHDEIVNNEVIGFPEQIIDIFPELRESEDERIRKGIIEIIKEVSGPDCDVYLNEKKQEKYLAWLEKQKEQKPDVNACKARARFIHNILSGNDMKKMVELYNDEIPEGKNAVWAVIYPHKPKEQKPAEWEDWKDKIDIPSCSSDEQKPAEWSEEDEKIRESLISLIETISEYYVPLETRNGYVAWLKSLRPSWKPSEEQMAWLKLAIDEAKEPLKSQLEELYKNIRENLIWK